MLCTEEKALLATKIVSAGMITKALSAYSHAFINEIERATQEAHLLSPQEERVLFITKKAMALAMIDLTTFCTAVIEETNLT